MPRPMGSRFAKLHLEQGELNAGRCINIYNQAYLQNKVADYAEMVVSFVFDPNISYEVNFLELEKVKAKLLVLEELMDELVIPQSELTGE